MDLKYTKEFIYINCAKRISEKIEEKGLSHRAIYRADPKMIGRIRRCQIKENRNTYLIQDSIRDCLKDKLEFDTFKDMLWGTDEEIGEEISLRLLFQSIILDLISPSSEYKNIVNEILCGYVPFARYSGLYQILFESGISIAQETITYFYDIDKIDVLTCIDTYADKAIQFLFNKCKSDFLQAFLRFANSTNSYKKWTYKFEKWIEKDLMILLCEYMPNENSFGKRIKGMIHSDYLHIAQLVSSYNPEEINAIKMLLASTEKYISMLEDIQYTYPDYDFSCLV